MAGVGSASEAVTGGGISMTKGGWPLDCLDLPSPAEAIAGAGTGVTHAGNDGSGHSTASSQEALPWGPPQRPKAPPGIGMVAMVDLVIVDLTAFCLEFICRDRDEPIPPRAEYQLAAAPS